MEPIKAGSQRRSTAQSSSVCDYVLCHFDHDSEQHHHRQLYAVLQKGIRDQALAAGLKLPPTRQLAQDLKIARNTVISVYEQLALEGYVQAGVGRGTYVADVKSSFGGPSSNAVKAACPQSSISKRGEHIIEEAGASQFQWGAFTPGVPELRLFPTQIWNRIQSRVWRCAKPQQLTYAADQGDLGLRQAISEYLQAARSVICSPDQVVITNGTQQSLHLIAHLLADPEDTVWLEDPGYWGARSVFRAAGLKLMPVPVDDEGLALTLHQDQTPPKLMFVCPSHQYPTGVLMSHCRRVQLLEYAAMKDIWVIEDDYDSELRYGARPLPSLQGLDQHERVIYLGTFSKTLFPSLRIAYLVLPTPIVSAFACALRELYREGQILHQVTLARFLSEGHYATHIRRMRAIYTMRQDAVIRSIHRHFGAKLPIIGGNAGLHLVLGLPSHIDDCLVTARALRAGIITRPLSMYYLDAQRRSTNQGLLIGYGAVNLEEIEPKFDQLASIIKTYL